MLDHHPLNLSDHLALTVNLDCKPHLLNPPEQAHPKLNWRKAILDGSIQEFQEYVSSNLSPLLNHSLETIAEIDEEIIAVTSILHHAATETIPVIRNSTKVKNYIRDDELKQKCQRSKVAWRHWRNAGRPRSGPLYQNMKAAKYEVKLYVRKCRARQERKVIQTRDEMFKNKDDRRFNIHQKRSHCRKLIVDGKSVTEEDDLLKCWKDYFSNLAQTQAGNSDLSDLDISHMEAMSHGFEDLILDTPFTTEEVENALRKLKTKRSGGADGLLAEHLKYGGPVFTGWLKRILNTIISLENIPASLKLGMIVPVCKGKGWDPLICCNYRGITLTSVLSKCLEILILERLESLFCERGFPHPSQTAYQKGLSCIDAIFSTQEVILKHIREGDTPYLSFFDLEKAFDSVEYSTLLSHIFKLGVNGKCWRLIKDWYSNTSSVVRVKDRHSESFPVQRGVKQGSVLSPTLFIAVMDSLLSFLESSGHRLTISGLNVW